MAADVGLAFEVAIYIYQVQFCFLWGTFAQVSLKRGRALGGKEDENNGIRRIVCDSVNHGESHLVDQSLKG